MNIPNIYAWMSANLSSSPTILELGAHYGEDTIKFLRMFPDAQITVFECDPRNIEALTNNHELQASKGIILVPKAVGRTCGTADFHQSDGKQREWTHSGSLRRPKNHLTIHPSVVFRSVITVEVTTLDAAMRPVYEAAEAPALIDFIWCDIQGAEGDMIQGATETLRRTRYLYTEFSNREEYEGQPNLNTLLSLLPLFEVIGFHENNVLLKNKELV